MPDSDYMENGLIRHNLTPPKALVEVDSVLEIGPGIRPFNWYVPEQYRALEPYKAYRDILWSAGYRAVLCDATGLAQYTDEEFDAVYALDVIEHMTRYEGKRFLEQAVRVAKTQVVIYTPLGFMEQHGDAWGLGGDYWQEHRSGWRPEDFPGWEIEKHAKSFFAVLTK